MAASSSLTPTLDAAANSFNVLEHHRASGRACADSGTGLQASPRPGLERGRVAFEHGLELDPLANRHDGDAMVADRSGKHDAVAGPRRRIDSDRPSGTMPMPEVVMKTWSPLPRSTTLVSPVTSATPDSSQAGRIEGRCARRSSIGSPSSRMNAADRNSGARAAHRQVVDRAVDRQLADVAAGEEERPDHERIGSESHPRRPSARCRRGRGNCTVA